MKEHPTLGEISLMLFVTEDTSEGTSNVGRKKTLTRKKSCVCLLTSA